MLEFIKNWRMKAWREIDAGMYAEAYVQFGGSVLSSPLTVEVISKLAQLPIHYYGYYQNDQLLAAIPVWGRWVAGSKEAFKKMGRKGIIDMGNAELILPISSAAKISIPVKANNISPIHADNITNLKQMDVDLCLAKPHRTGGLSKKFRYNQRRALRLLEEKGVAPRTVQSLRNSEVANIYINLFEKRWGFKPVGYERFEELLDGLRPLLFGSLLELEGEAIAFQLIYKCESADHISIEYINSGVDPDYQPLSPGSALTFLNTQQAWALSEQLSKPLRYSFGKADAAYKEMWCTRSVVYSS
jgi:hypothetical protein